MSLEMTASVDLTLEIDHNGPSSDLEEARLQALLEVYMRTPDFRMKLSDVLGSMIRLSNDTELGWVTDDISYEIVDVLEVTVTKAKSLQASRP